MTATATAAESHTDHAAPINRNGPGEAGHGASLPFLPPFLPSSVPAGGGADIALTWPGSVPPDLRICGALRSRTQEVCGR